MKVVTKTLTYQEYRKIEFPDDENTLFELINGEIVARNSPNLKHQNAVLNIASEVRNFLKTNDLGRVFVAPLDVVLDSQNAIQPDVFFIKNERLFILDNSDEVVNGTPDLVLEVISPSSVRRDRFDKMKLYEQFAVKEYWLVDPTNKSIEIYKMQENRLVLVSMADETGSVQSNLLEGLELKLAEIFI